MSYFTLDVEKAAWHVTRFICDGAIIISEKVGKGELSYTAVWQLKCVHPVTSNPTSTYPHLRSSSTCKDGCGTFVQSEIDWLVVSR